MTGSGGQGARRERRIGAVAIVAALALLAAVPAGLAQGGRPEARAAANPSVVLWFGGRAPGTDVSGVLVAADGKAQVLAPLNRAAGTVKVVKKFTPSAGQLAAIRSAATAALSGPNFAGKPAEDGFFATAVIEQGTKRKAIIGANALTPDLQKLLSAVQTAVPAQAAGARRALGVIKAHAADDPATAPCPPGQQATNIGREVSLKDAARLGIVKLTSKGGFDGDDMAIDAKFKDVPLPTVVRMNIEVVSDIDGVDTGLEAKVEKELAGQTIKSGPLKGQPVKFDLNVHRRLPTDPPRPCWHQLAVSEDKNLRDHVSGLGPGPESGEIGVFDRSAWTHEVLHLAGLDDRYNDVFRTNSGKTIPLPENGLEGDALAAELAKFGVKPKNGALASQPQKGYGGNIMAQVPGKLFQSDLKYFAQRGQNNLIVHSSPGDVLESKDGSLQNLINGAPVDLVLKRGGSPVHVDGMVVYCIDLHHHIPAKGTVYDVLGNVSELGGPAMDALARLTALAARLEPGVLLPTPLAQDAIWRVTDDSPPFDETKAFLAAAQVPDDPSTLQYNAPHFVDPNAASPETAAVTADGQVLPALDLGKPPPRLKAPRPRLLGAAFKPASLKRARVLAAVLQVRLAAAGDRVTLTLQRRSGHRFKRVKGLGRRRLASGNSIVLLALKRLAPGHYRVKVKGSRGRARYAALTIRA